MIDGIKVIEISTDKEVNYIFEDMGDIISYPDGEFFTSKLKINERYYYSRVDKAITLLMLEPAKYRYTQDCANFEKHGFRILAE